MASAVQTNRVNQIYGRNLEMLAKSMRDRAEQEQAALEGRGVLRSGEADLAASRRAEDEATQKRYYLEDRDYQLASLAEGGSGGGGGGRSSGGGGGGGGGGQPTTGGRSYDDILAEMLRLAGFKAPLPAITPPQRTVITPSGMGSGRTKFSPYKGPANFGRAGGGVVKKPVGSR